MFKLKQALSDLVKLTQENCANPSYSGAMAISQQKLNIIQAMDHRMRTATFEQEKINKVLEVLTKVIDPNELGVSPEEIQTVIEILSTPQSIKFKPETP